MSDWFTKRADSAPKYTRQEEHELAVQCKAGDTKSGDLLVESCLRYVIQVAQKFRRYGVPVEDLIGEGNIGLLEGLNRFDPHAGFRLITFAAYWIRHAIALRVRQGRTVITDRGTGALQKKVFHRLARERRRLELALVPSQDWLTHLAVAFDTTPELIQPIIDWIDLTVVSVDGPIWNGHGYSTLDAMVPSDAPSPEDIAIERDQRRKAKPVLRRALGQLSSIEQTIVQRRLMVDEEDAPTQAELGHELGLSHARISQIEAKARATLRAALEGVEDDPVRIGRKQQEAVKEALRSRPTRKAPRLVSATLPAAHCVPVIAIPGRRFL